MVFQAALSETEPVLLELLDLRSATGGEGFDRVTSCLGLRWEFDLILGRERPSISLESACQRLDPFANGGALDRKRFASMAKACNPRDTKNLNVLNSFEINFYEVP